MKPTFIYLSYFSLTEVKDYQQKLARYYFCYEALQHLAEHYEVYVFDVYGGPTTAFKDRKVHYRVFHQSHNHFWQIPFAMHRAISLLKPDAIYCQGLRQMYFLMFLASSLPKHTCFFVQNHAEQAPGGIKKHLLRFADKWVHTYFFSAKGLANNWVKKRIIKNEQKINELVEASTSLKPMGMTKRTGNKYLWVGRLDTNKDPLTAVKGFVAFAREFPEARLSMVYARKDLLPEIKTYLENHPEQAKQISLLGQLPHNDMAALYQQHDFFLLASNYEGGSIALIEAMAFNCIPIVSDIPANRTMINQGKAGFLFPPGNTNKLIHCLKQSQTMDLAAMRKEVNLQYQNHLSYEAIAQKLHLAVQRHLHAQT